LNTVLTVAEQTRSRNEIGANARALPRPSALASARHESRAGTLASRPDGTRRVPGQVVGAVAGIQVHVKLDDLDRAIIRALVKDARATYSEIGTQVGLSAPAVKRRVDRLVATGAITGFSARVEPSALGWTTEAYVELFCQGKTSPAEIGLAVSRHPEVISACTVTGEADALLHIRATDVRHVERVIERLAAEPFVVRTKSSIVLSRLINGSPQTG
jgi:DNA-binding Lrp family transcriptional regulator